MKNLKRLSTLFLSIVLALAFAVPAFAAGTGYTDVAADAWYAGAVAYARENGLMNGTGTTTFSPNANMELAMLVTVRHARRRCQCARRNPCRELVRSRVRLGRGKGPALGH